MILFSFLVVEKVQWCRHRSKQIDWNDTTKKKKKNKNDDNNEIRLIFTRVCIEQQTKHFNRFSVNKGHTNNNKIGLLYSLKTTESINQFHHRDRVMLWSISEIQNVHKTENGKIGFFLFFSLSSKTDTAFNFKSVKIIRKKWTSHDVF